jgi:hypothetical protein
MQSHHFTHVMTLYLCTSFSFPVVRRTNSDKQLTDDSVRFLGFSRLISHLPRKRRSVLSCSAAPTLSASKMARFGVLRKANPSTGRTSANKRAKPNDDNDEDDDEDESDASSVQVVGEDPSAYECPVCYLYMKDEVFQCREGHLLCTECVEKVDECPSCRTKLPEEDQRILNRAIMNQAGSITLSFLFHSLLTCRCYKTPTHLPCIPSFLTFPGGVQDVSLSAQEPRLRLDAGGNS